MKRSIQSMSLVGSILVAMSTNLLADEIAPAAEKKADVSSKSFSSTNPEGATLPQGIFRTRVITRGNVGTERQFGEDKKYIKDNGHSLIGTSLVLDYGILNDLTAQINAPFVLKHENEVKGQTTKHKTGLSDVEVGARYKAFDNGSSVFAVGLGMRFPTGQFSNVNFAKEGAPTGSGSYDLGLRLNFDQQLVHGLWFSVEEQAEVQVSAVENKPSKSHFDKKGLTHKAFAQLNYGLGGLSDSMSALSVKTRYAYETAGKVEIRESKMEAAPASYQHKAGIGAGFDARAYGIPAYVDALYMAPIAGKNANISPTVEVTVGAYM